MAKRTKKQILRSQADKLIYEIYLKPNCEICNKKAQQLHHFYPRSCYNHLRYCSENLISLCNSCHFKLTFQNRRLEDFIREKRGNSWYNRLKKKALNKPKNFQTNLQWYQTSLARLIKEKSV